MSTRQDREEELTDDAYSQGRAEGFQEGKEAAIAAVKKYVEENPWSYTMGARGFEIIEIDALLDFIHDRTP